MREFSDVELSRMQATQDGAMQDTCVMEVWSAGSKDNYGVQQPSYTDSAEMRCGLELTKQDESPSADTELADGKLRLPINTLIDRRNRVRITKRFGKTLSTPLVYEFVGPPQRGPSGLLIDIRLVTNG